MFVKKHEKANQNMFQKLFSTDGGYGWPGAGDIIDESGIDFAPQPINPSGLPSFAPPQAPIGAMSPGQQQGVLNGVFGAQQQGFGGQQQGFGGSQQQGYGGNQQQQGFGGPQQGFGQAQGFGVGGIDVTGQYQNFAGLGYGSQAQNPYGKCAR